MTVAFFPDGDEASCQANDTSKGLFFTTDAPPNFSAVCFNVSDLFTQENDTGIAQALMPARDRDGNILNTLSWSLENRDLFDPQANYSRVWYRQQNQTITVGEGASFIFQVYAFPDCEQLGGRELDEDQYPWFLTNCQTEDGGKCRTVPYSIQSFGISEAAWPTCASWAYKGDQKKDDASRLGKGLLRFVMGVASTTVLFLLV